MNKPTLGRIVRYKTDTGEARPAIITNYEPADEMLTLTVFNIDSTIEGIKTNSMASGPREGEARQWWWPDRV